MKNSGIALLMLTIWLAPHSSAIIAAGFSIAWAIIFVLEVYAEYKERK